MNFNSIGSRDLDKSLSLQGRSVQFEQILHQFRYFLMKRNSFVLSVILTKLRVNQSNVNCKTHCSIATYAALCLLVITCSSKIYILNCLTSMKFLNHTQKKKIDNMAAVAQCILGAECVSSALYFLVQIRSTKTHF